MRSWRPGGQAAGAGMLCSLAAGAAGGAALMYLLDPERGRRRRALARDQLLHASRRAAIGARKTAEYTSDRARGVVAETAARFRRDTPSDRVLTERVRSAIGRAVSHPGSIEVEAYDGTVTLAGPVLADEAEGLLAAVEAVRGVHKVEDRLELFAARENIPGLQGTAGWRGRRPAPPSPTGRLLQGAAGAMLASWGLARRDVVGAGASLVGAAIATRGLTSSPTRRRPGSGGTRAHVHVHKTIHIEAPLEAVFDFWSNYENFPRVMTNVREVRDLGNGRSHWTVAGPAGTTIEWEAELTEFVPSEIIAWRSIEGAAVRNAGTVRFRPDHAGTRVNIQLSYHPPGGTVGHAIAKAFGADPKSEMDQDLMRMKTTIETGHAPHDAAQKGGAAPAGV